MNRAVLRPLLVIGAVAVLLYAFACLASGSNVGGVGYLHMFAIGDDEKTTIDAEKFALQLCPIVGGRCNERATEATPRTRYSSRDRAGYARWFDFDARLRNELSVRLAAPPKLKLLFWGDSIFESFRGTSYGRSAARAAANPAVFNRHFAAETTAIQAISGDQTQHTLWRMAQQRRSGTARLPLAAVGVVLIGTNNLGAGMSVADAAAGIVAVARAARHFHHAVVLCTLLPRGTTTNGTAAKATFAAKATQAKVKATNDVVRAAVRAEERGAARAIILSECGGLFDDSRGRRAGALANEAQWTPRATLMPDLLHPNAAGSEAWLACLERDVERVLASVGG